MPEQDQQRQPDVPLHGYIPAHVRHAPISPGAKILYAEISGMTIKKGYCYATNRYLSDIFGVSRRTIRNWLSELESVDVIKSSYDRNRQKHKRRIYLIEYVPPPS